MVRRFMDQQIMWEVRYKWRKYLPGEQGGGESCLVDFICFS